MDSDEVLLVEQIALGDERVKTEIAKLQLPDQTVIVADPWGYGKVYLSLNRQHEEAKVLRL